MYFTYIKDMDDGSLFTSNVMHIVAWMVLL